MFSLSPNQTFLCLKLLGVSVSSIRKASVFTPGTLLTSSVAIHLAPPVGYASTRTPLAGSPRASFAVQSASRLCGSYSKLPQPYRVEVKKGSPATKCHSPNYTGEPSISTFSKKFRLSSKTLNSSSLAILRWTSVSTLTHSTSTGLSQRHSARQKNSKSLPWMKSIARDLPSAHH